MGEAGDLVLVSGSVRVQIQLGTAQFTVKQAEQGAQTRGERHRGRH